MQHARHGTEHGGSTERELLQRNLPGLERSMTFAAMARSSASFSEIAKHLPWLFPAVCHRKDQATLTTTEQSRYLCAIDMINADGTLGQLVETHSAMHMQHTSARLLPWHRIFLYLFEEALHNYHPDVCVPYWDWTKAGEQHFPAWLNGVLPSVHTPSQTINVLRSPGSDAALGSIVSMVPAAMAKTGYNDFASLINGIHGSYTCGSAAPCRTPQYRPPIPSSGCTMRTSIGCGGAGTTAPQEIIRTQGSRERMR